MRNFYGAHHEQVTADIRAGAISGAAKDKLIKLDSEIETPFTFAYIDGFYSLVDGIRTMGIFCAFALAICLAPMFAGEYSTGADQLILSSKLGKSKVISAKLFTAISLSVIFFMFLFVLTVIMGISIYGYDGADAPFQLIMTFIAYPLTILESVMIFTACAFFGTLLTAALTLLLSSKLKSPFGVIIIISVLLFVPMMFHVPETVVWLYNIFSLLPASMMSVWAVFSHVPYDFFGLIVLPYIFLPVFAVIASIAVLPSARRSFRNHQI
jgi:ABC-type transport system involved in multi-copper enzyme maturation permease subunit